MSAQIDCIVGGKSASQTGSFTLMQFLSVIISDLGVINWLYLLSKSSLSLGPGSAQSYIMRRKLVQQHAFY